MRVFLIFIFSFFFLYRSDGCSVYLYLVNEGGFYKVGMVFIIFFCSINDDIVSLILVRVMINLFIDRVLVVAIFMCFVLVKLNVELKFLRGILFVRFVFLLRYFII